MSAALTPSTNAVLRHFASSVTLNDCADNTECEGGGAGGAAKHRPSSKFSRTDPDAGPVVKFEDILRNGDPEVRSAAVVLIMEDAAFAAINTMRILAEEIPEGRIDAAAHRAVAMLGSVGESDWFEREGAMWALAMLRATESAWHHLRVARSDYSMAQAAGDVAAAQQIAESVAEFLTPFRRSL